MYDVLMKKKYLYWSLFALVAIASFTSAENILKNEQSSLIHKKGYDQKLDREWSLDHRGCKRTVVKSMTLSNCSAELPVTYKRHKTLVENAIKSGQTESFLNGVIKLDLGITDGVVLPIDKVSTVNKEPILYDCLKVGGPAVGSDTHGPCYTQYELKPNLYVSIPIYRKFSYEDKMLDSYLEKCVQIESYLKLHPDFYP